MKWEKATSIVSVVLAFLASQHHTLHMLLLTVGIGGGAMTFMTMFPTVRRVMLLMALVMTGVTLWQGLRPGRPPAMRYLAVGSAALSLGLTLWSVAQLGL